LSTSNPPDGSIDALTRWTVVSRAAVLPMTLVLVAGLLAAVAGI
jgi:1,4-dihydroxy-2-naphthoate octaprenyltransferase